MLRSFPRPRNSLPNPFINSGRIGCREGIRWSRNGMSSVDSLSKRELLALLETLGQVSAETDRQRLIQTILDTACRMTNSPDGSVLLFDPERSGLFFAAAQGEKAQELLEGWGERSNQRVPLSGSTRAKPLQVETS